MRNKLHRMKPAEFYGRRSEKVNLRRNASRTPDLEIGVFGMLTGNNYHDCSRYNRLEMKNVNKDIVSWLEDIVEENNSRVERKEWKSKYNSYVVYDYEPFCTDGFEINLVITSYDEAYLNFIKYLYDEKVSTIDYLNSCISQ